MNWKKSALLVTTGIFLLLAVVLVVPSATAQSGPNLLTNPGFEEGHHHQDSIAEIVVPDGWQMYWVDGVTFAGAWDSLPANRPETVVWNANGGIPEGEEVFWRHAAKIGYRCVIGGDAKYFISRWTNNRA